MSEAPACLRTRTRILTFALATLVAGTSLPARAADPNEGGAAAAESLFQEGRKLADAKRWSDACPKFLASQKLAPAVGTLLNLADCYEKAGQLASAWARFHEAISLAQRIGRPDREKTARERADKLEPRLIRLTIYVAEKQAEVKLDGNVLDPAIIGTGVPVDPGKHTIEANVKGKVPFSTTLDVSERARTPSIEIPELEQADEPKPATSASTPAKKAEVQWNRDTGQTQRMLGLVAGGVGLVGIGLGAYFGLRTFSRWDEAQEHCTGGDCDATGVDLQARAKNAGLASTIGFAAGGALLATGVVLYLTAPSGAAKSGSTSPPNRDLRLGMGPGAVTLGGSF